MSKELVKIETYYLVDYENVGSLGLTGYVDLTENDHVHVFFTRHAKKIDLEVFGAKIEAEFVTHRVTAGKQSADMHIASYLGYLIARKDCDKKRIIIVSNDKGFDQLIRFWKATSAAKIFRSKWIGAEEKLELKPDSRSISENDKEDPKVSERKSALNEDIQRAMARSSRYSNEVIGNVAGVCVRNFGRTEYLSTVHNNLRNQYKEYVDIYKIIKPVLINYLDAGTRKPISEKTRLNTDIQRELSLSGYESGVINDVASRVVKFAGKPNGKQRIYRSIIQIMGQKEGLTIYREIKDMIPDEIKEL